MKPETPATADLGALDSAKYLYLRSLSEPRDNSLRLIVQEAVDVDGPVALNAPAFSEILTNVRPIESTEHSNTFELSWAHYVAYLVTEECAGSTGEYHDEVFSGNLFRIYSQSHFLEYLARDTGGHSEPVQHYKIVCLNHLIDVAAYTPPQIRQVYRGDS
jgi:hypothetical protein